MKADIIALGESLRGFDFDQLTNFRIVLNNGYKYIDYDMNVWFDNPNKFCSDIEHRTNPKLETLKDNGGKWIHRGKPIQREYPFVSSNNSSLILAVNIALHLGYKEIDIYGADFKVDKYIRFYDEAEVDKETKDRANRSYEIIRIMWDKLKFNEDEKVNLIKV